MSNIKQFPSIFAADLARYGKPGLKTVRHPVRAFAIARDDGLSGRSFLCEDGTWIEEGPIERACRIDHERYFDSIARK